MDHKHWSSNVWLTAIDKNLKQTDDYSWIYLSQFSNFSTLLASSITLQLLNFIFYLKLFFWQTSLFRMALQRGTVSVNKLLHFELGPKGLCCSPSRWSPTKPMGGEGGIEGSTPPFLVCFYEHLEWLGQSGRCREKRMLKTENPLWKDCVIQKPPGHLRAPLQPSQNNRIS